MGPLIVLLKDSQSGKAVANNKAVSALHMALYFIGNAFATLSVERRCSILRQLNQQLTPLADEEFENDELFMDDFGKRAKERTDAIRSLSRSSPFFDWATPLKTDSRAKGVAEKAKPIASPPTTSRGSRWNKTNPQQGRSYQKK